MSRPFKILVLKHGALGDVIRTSYIAESLKAKYPGCWIEWVTRNEALDLVRFHPHIDQVWGVDKTGAFKPGEGITSNEYDWVISLDDEAASCSLATQVKSSRISGAFISDGKIIASPDVGLWFEMGLISSLGKEEADRLKVKNKLSHAEIFKRMLGLDFIRPSFFNDPAIEKRVKALFRDMKTHIGLNLSAGKRWASKSLRQEEAVLLIRHLLEMHSTKGLDISLLGGEDDLEYNAALLGHFSQSPSLKLVAPSSLLEFAAVIASQTFVICSDTMALHMAIAQKVPNVSYYAPTSAVEIETFGTGRKIMSTSSDYCSYKRDADNSSITAERILKELSNLPVKIQ